MKQYILAIIIILGSISFVGCESDRDSNPIYQIPTEFKLNVPRYANSVYDLADAESVLLTCSQANYGFSAAATYQVEVSVNEDFSDSTTLISEYRTTRLEVSAKEIAVALVPLLGIDNKEDFPTDSFPVFFRLKSSIPTIGESSVIYSNVIELPKVKSYFALDDMKLPENLYLIGGSFGWDWSTAPAMVKVYGAPGKFWHLCYIGGEDTGDGIKFNTATAWDGNQFAVGENVTITGAEYTTDGDGNLKLEGKAGWKLLQMTVEIEGRGYNYTLDILDPNVYVFGPATGGIWAADDNWKFTVPTTPDGDFVSPALVADPNGGTELRLCVVLPNTDWWKSEFIFFDGKIVYRADGGDQERVPYKVGEKVYLNFVTGDAKTE